MRRDEVALTSEFVPIGGVRFSRRLRLDNGCEGYEGYDTSITVSKMG